MTKKDQILSNLRQRIEDISTLIFEVANGNFDYTIQQSEEGNELDAIIEGVNMLGQELKTSTVSRDYMQSIYSGVVDMLFILDKDFRIQKVNDSVTQLLGFADFELTGIHLGEVVESKYDAINEVRKSIRAKGEYRNLELSFLTRYNTQIPTSSSFSTLFNKSGEVDGYMIIAADISMLKETEKALIKAKEEAEEANKAKGRFLSNMSHEIRTPLNGIIGFTELMESTKMNEPQQEYISMIKTSGKNLAKLLNDVLDLNKIDIDKLTLESVPFDFKANLMSNLNPYKYTAEEKGLSMDISFDSTIPEVVQGDPTRINQILINLVGNAIKFTEHGGISVNFNIQERSKNQITLSCEITDSGIGIPEENFETVFKTFTQADNSITRKYGGSGLGLSICKQLAHLMGGEIGIHSPPKNNKHGSTFWFTLPLEIVSDIEEIVVEPPIKLNVAENTTILAVDDNRVNLMLVEKILQRSGASITTATNGEEALEAMKVQSFDMVLMDIQMPVMDGYTAVKIARKLGYTKPIIALSANVEKENVEKCKRVGMDDYLQKPFQMNDLFKVLQKWVTYDLTD